MTPTPAKPLTRSRIAPHLFLLATVYCLLSTPLSQAQDEPIPPQVQSAVDRGLRWLAENQDSHGAWQNSMGRSEPTAAVTSLAALAFMARGHVPGQGPYGDHLNKAFDHVISLQESNGVISGGGDNRSMYEHGISTVFLCEAYGMLDNTRQKRAKTAIEKAVRVILTAQQVPKSGDMQGGWRYRPESNDADISVSGWQLMALRGAANIGAAVPPSAINAGIAYIKNRALPDGGFSYAGRTSPNTARTATGVVSLQLLGQHNSKEALAGGDYLLTHPLDKGEFNSHYFYTVYYCAQAAWQLGGRYWESLNPIVRNSILQRQNVRGYWSVANTNEQQGGDAYGTSMAILALTVPYRYLPIYQR